MATYHIYRYRDYTDANIQRIAQARYSKPGIIFDALIPG